MSDFEDQLSSIAAQRAAEKRRKDQEAERREQEKRDAEYRNRESQRRYYDQMAARRGNLQQLHVKEDMEAFRTRLNANGATSGWSYVRRLSKKVPYSYSTGDYDSDVDTAGNRGQATADSQASFLGYTVTQRSFGLFKEYKVFVGFCDLRLVVYGHKRGIDWRALAESCAKAETEDLTARGEIQARLVSIARVYYEASCVTVK